MMSNRVVFPGVETGFPYYLLEGIKGLSGYATRGIMIGALYCVLFSEDENAVKLHQFLRRFGLGAENLIFSNPENLELQLRKKNVNGSCSMEPFYVGPASAEFFPHRWFGDKIPDLGASQKANSKIWLRRNCDKKFFPYFQIVGLGNTERSLAGIIKGAIDRSLLKEIIVKEEDSASGSGMKTFSEVKPAVSHTKETLVRLQEEGRNPELIIEEKRKKIFDGSIRFWIPRLGQGDPEFRGFTKQFVDGQGHKGNILTSNGSIPDIGFEAMVLCAGMRPVIRKIQEMEYWGYLTVDFFRDNSGKFWVSEINSRMTNSYFLEDFLRQVGRNVTGIPLSIGSYNCNTSLVRSFDEIIEMIGEDVFNGCIGAFPNLIAPNKVGIVFVDTAFGRVQQKLFEIKKRFYPNE